MITMEILGKIRRMYLRDKLSLHDTYGVRSFIIIFLKNIKNNINIKCDNKRPDPGLCMRNTSVAPFSDAHRYEMSAHPKSISG